MPRRREPCIVAILLAAAAGGSVAAAQPEPAAAPGAEVERLSVAAGSGPPAAPPMRLDGPSGRPSAPASRPLQGWRVLAALAGAFAVLAAFRTVQGRRLAGLPPDVFEVLGQASLGGQQSVRIVRFGPRTLLLGVSAAGCRTLAELADPEATAAVVAACRSAGCAATPARQVRPRGEVRP